jgi:hypothetical protein
MTRRQIAMLISPAVCNLRPKEQRRGIRFVQLEAGKANVRTALKVDLDIAHQQDSVDKIQLFEAFPSAQQAKEQP